MIIYKIRKNNLKKLKNYNIGKDKKLYKYVNIIDNISFKHILKNLQVVPPIEINNILSFYHELTGHRNYHILMNKIKSDGLYWNSITNDCKHYIKECINVKQKINQIFYLHLLII